MDKLLSYFKKQQSEEMNLIADELDKMLVPLCKQPWDLSLIRPYVKIVRIVCQELRDFELYHVVMRELVEKQFWKLPLGKKWQPLSLMQGNLSSGNLMNQISSKVRKKIKTDLTKLIKECPNKKAKKILQDFLIYYR